MPRPLLALLAALVAASSASAYVEAPQSFGSIVQQSTVICTMTVEKVDKTNQLIIFKKGVDLKGKMEQTTIKHNIGKGGLRPGEWQEVMNSAEVGKTALFFSNGSASETYLGTTWYQAYPNGEWWGPMTHTEPFLLRSYYGKADKCAQAVKDIIAGKEVLVPCMVDGDKELLHKKTAKVQKLKASLKLLEYDPKRDFAGWGGANDDVRKLNGWAGFEKLAALGKGDAEAQSVSVLDIDGDGKPDLCLCGGNKVSLLLQADDGFSEATLPGFGGGARSAVWADYTGDGKPDLMLATTTGPRLYTNLGKGTFRDDSKLLPKEDGYALSAAAWGDFNGDGKPDLLLANGFHGPKVYLNVRPDDAIPKSAPPKMGAWHAVGPFRNMKDVPKTNDTEFEPEKELDKAIDTEKVYKGKRDTEIKWAKKEWEDNSVTDLLSYGENCVTYVTREIEVGAATEMPASFGFDDAITIWLNGEKLHSDFKPQAVAPDQAKLTLKLKKGKNRLTMKVYNTGGAYGFYFGAGQEGISGPPWFQDASAAWGLPDAVKGDTLAVADFDGDGRQDFLFGGGTGGMLFKNTGKGFEAVKESGLSYKPGKVGPALADFDADGKIDLFVPQADGGGKLFHNDGNFKFTDVTAKSGDLAKLPGGGVGAAWGDFDNDGKPDLLVACLKGPCRYFKNAGDGKFTDQTEAIGLHQKIFNTQAAAFADLNNDGRLDVILHNEGQESAALYGSAGDGKGHSAAVVKLPKSSGWGGTVSVTTADGKPAGTCQLLGGDGRGSQPTLAPRFALAPGEYTITYTGTDGKSVKAKLTMTKEPAKVAFE